MILTNPSLLLDILPLDWTWRDGILAITAMVIFVATLVKAINDIRTDGWEPFKKKWTAWFARRRAERKILGELVESVAEIKKTIHVVSHELLTNGGSSLKDVVIGINETVGNIQARVAARDETDPTPTFELDADGQMRMANAVFRNLLNADEKELMHRDYMSRIHREDKTQFIREVAEAVQNMMPLDSTVRFRLDAYSYVTVRLSAQPDVRTGGELKGYRGTASKVDDNA